MLIIDEQVDDEVGIDDELDDDMECLDDEEVDIFILLQLVEMHLLHIAIIQHII